MSLPAKPEGRLLEDAARRPFIQIETLAPPGGLLVITPHPDDETLGCGQALFEAGRAGLRIVLVLLTDGEGSHPNSRQYGRERLIELRAAELNRALEILLPNAAPKVLNLRLPDGSSSFQMLRGEHVEAVARAGREVGASSVWTSWTHDPHCDHQTAAALGELVARALAIHCFHYTVWGRFTGQTVPAERLHRFHSREAAAAKERAMEAYRSQLTPLITDDPTGFVMPPAFVAHFAQAPEIFIRG